MRGVLYNVQQESVSRGGDGHDVQDGFGDV